MSLKLVIPRDPLIFRDGKPFTAVPGERAKSISFPFPATLAGAVRTREGTSNGEFDKARIDELKKLSMRGPFLVELDKDQNIKWYFPAPADALLISKNEVTKIYSLAPLEIENDRSNLEDKLKLVGTKEIVKDKPMKKPPLYWTSEIIQEWLYNPSDGEFDLTNTIQGPTRETRTHVRINPDTQTAFSGTLFQTSGMEFIKNNKTLSQASQLALAVETSAAFANGVDSLGGERRVIRWESSDETLPPCPPEIKKQIVEEGHCRLMLATPAYFKEGYLSSEFEAKYNLKIQAVALPRYQTISGWDYAANDGRGAPKPTHRLVPAGSVYFLKFNENVTSSDIENFIDTVWLHSISDDPQAQTDGFGLALLGTWNGELRKLEVKHGKKI